MSEHNGNTRLQQMAPGFTEAIPPRSNAWDSAEEDLPQSPEAIAEIRHSPVPKRARERMQKENEQPGQARQDLNRRLEDAERRRAVGY